MQLLIGFIVLAYGLTAQNGFICIGGIAIVMELVIRTGMNDYYERNKPEPKDDPEDYIMD